MKFLFSSSDTPEIVFFKSVLDRAGISCKVLHDETFPPKLETAIYPELWVQKEEDYPIASLLFASQRRTARPAY
jgi:hypothetical protein